MNQAREEKLKPLLNEVPPGFLVDAAWLTGQHINRKSIFNYVERRWLENAGAFNAKAEEALFVLKGGTEIKLFYRAYRSILI